MVEFGSIDPSSRTQEAQSVTDPLGVSLWNKVLIGPYPRDTRDAAS